MAVESREERNHRRQGLRASAVSSSFWFELLHASHEQNVLEDANENRKPVVGTDRSHRRTGFLRRPLGRRFRTGGVGESLRRAPVPGRRPTLSPSVRGARANARALASSGFVLRAMPPALQMRQRTREPPPTSTEAWLVSGCFCCPSTLFWTTAEPSSSPRMRDGVSSSGPIAPQVANRTGARFDIRGTECRISRTGPPVSATSSRRLLERVEIGHFSPPRSTARATSSRSPTPITICASFRTPIRRGTVRVRCCVRAVVPWTVGNRPAVVAAVRSDRGRGMESSGRRRSARAYLPGAIPLDPSRRCMLPVARETPTATAFLVRRFSVRPVSCAWQSAGRHVGLQTIDTCLAQAVDLGDRLTWYQSGRMWKSEWSNGRPTGICRSAS